MSTDSPSQASAPPHWQQNAAPSFDGIASVERLKLACASVFAEERQRLASALEAFVRQPSNPGTARD